MRSSATTTATTAAHSAEFIDAGDGRGAWWRFGVLRAGVSMGAALALSCNGAGAGPIVPSMPDSALLDIYDGAVLERSADQAPTFGEVSEPRDDSPRRFRAWLGWGAPECTPCPFGQDATCRPQCSQGKPFVCTRPSRTVACRADEMISTTIETNGEPPPGEGAYIFEGRFRPSAADGALAFVVDQVVPLRMPDDAGR